MLSLKNNFKKILFPYIQPKILLLTLFGFVNGFFLLVTGNTLNFWVAKEGISKQTLGLISLVGVPYALKYLFAPLIDRYKLPIISNFFSARKSWTLLSLFCLTIFIYFLSLSSPNENIIYMCSLGFIVAFFSACIDIVLNAYRIKSIVGKYIGHASSAYLIGYRIGMLISGAGSIYLSYYISWNEVYKVIAIFASLLFFGFLFLNEQEEEEVIDKPSSSGFYRIFVEPFKHLGSISEFTVVIIFVSTYLVSDNMIGVMLNSFLLEYGFNEVEIATAGKSLGIVSAILGGLVAGSLVPILGMKRSLIYYAAIHSITHFSYFMIIKSGHSLKYLYLTTALEALAGGAKMAVYFSYISSLCKGKYIGTQYALLFSIMGISRTIFPSISGYLVSYVGWEYFFAVMILVSLPSIFIIKFIKLKN